ncbi:triose-phosphate isomerase [Candidatus Babeliales bacterium]|nr:triose-phosphate isomerase [Candidatus Babeliales bacterium]
MDAMKKSSTKNHQIFVANWKMYTSADEEIRIGSENYDNFIDLARNPNHEIILCPSFLSLHTLSNIFKETPVQLGAQDCSEHNKGAFTGQVSAKSLKAAGCSYCIIGHSERRQFNAENNQQISLKFQHLLDQGIAPIVCVGENETEYQEHRALQVLEDQLKEIFSLMRSSKYTLRDLPICIAYEPIWAIGTGNVAQPEHLNTVFAWLANQTKNIDPSINWKFLYGGSVKANNAAWLKEIEYLDGFLIGGASLDFQEFEKIVYCTN